MFRYFCRFVCILMRGLIRWLIAGRLVRVIVRVRIVLSGFVGVSRWEDREVRIISRCIWECRGLRIIVLGVVVQDGRIIRFVFLF